MALKSLIIRFLWYTTLEVNQKQIQELKPQYMVEVIVWCDIKKKAF